MAGLMDELTAIKAVEDKITSNKVANFAYTDTAYQDPATYADGVSTYDPNAEQNIPVANASTLKVNATILTKGWRAQASAITRMLMNHFLGRISYNLNKVNDLFSLLLTKLMAYIGQPNGLATLDANGKVALLNNVVNTGDSNVPVENGTSKFTSGGAYSFFGGQVNASTWLSGVFGWVIGKFWELADSNIHLYGVHYANGLWVGGSSGTNKGFWWSEDGKHWVQGTTTDTFEGRIVSIYYANGVWVACNEIISTGERGGIWWSEDGKAWTRGTDTSTHGAPVSSHYFVLYANGLWIVGGHLGLSWSEDGKAWTECSGSVGYEFRTIYYADGLWVAGSTSAGLWWSTDGKTWAQGTGSNTTYQFNTICYANGMWIAGSEEHGFWESTDGKAWVTSGGSYYQSTVYKICYENGLWVAVINSGVLWNPDPSDEDWNNASTTITNCKVLCYAKGIWVTGGASSGGAWWSTDADTWEKAKARKADLFPEEGIVTLYYANGLWLAGTRMEGIWYSDFTLAFQE